MTTPPDAALARLLASAKDGEASEARGAAYDLSEALERAGGELPTAAIVEFVTAWAEQAGAESPQRLTNDDIGAWLDDEATRMESSRAPRSCVTTARRLSIQAANGAVGDFAAINAAAVESFAAGRARKATP